MTKTNTTEYLVISASLRSASLSRVMAETLCGEYEKLGVPNQMIDLREYVLPLCDGESAYDHPHVKPLTTLIGAARVILVATPVYNYNVNASLKNLIELTGSAWENKIVGFLCAAGGTSSYMAVMSLANSLMLDFRCLIIPRYVYAKGDDFSKELQPTTELARRIGELAASSLKIRNG